MDILGATKKCILSFELKIIIKLYLLTETQKKMKKKNFKVFHFIWCVVVDCNFKTTLCYLIVTMRQQKTFFWDFQLKVTNFNLM